MTLSSLFLVCSHGRRSAHEPIANGLEVWQAGDWCPGGRPATLEDLGGEKVNWCGYHDAEIVDRNAGTCWDAEKHHPCKPEQRILIPLPQMVAGESL